MKEKYLAKQRDTSRVSVTPPFPKIIKIDTCNICNYHCVFCPNAIQIDKVGCIDDELCRKIIKDAYEAGAQELCVSSTGEPLINPNLEDYIQLAKLIGYKYVFFNTNGYLLTMERSRKLLMAGVDSVKISINAGRKCYKAIHGVDAYERVLQNVKEFNQLKLELGNECKLSISYVAVKPTQSEFEEVKRDFGDYVEDVFLMNANSRGGSVDENVQKLYIGDDEFSYQFPCSQLFTNVYVTAEGYMTLCCQDFDMLTFVADLRHESISDAWNNEVFTNFRRRYLNQDWGGLCAKTA